MTKIYETRKNLETWRKATADQLRDELADLRKEQFNLRFQKATGQLERPLASATFAARSLALKRSCPRSRSSRRKESTMPKRIMVGTVVSNKMTKTAVVKVERTFLHPLFKKTVRKSKRYHAHDENNSAQVGQIVEIQECPPRSKLKRWEILPAKGDAA